jgi:hypothetical protein
MHRSRLPEHVRAERGQQMAMSEARTPDMPLVGPSFLFLSELSGSVARRSRQAPFVRGAPKNTQ